MASQQRRYFTTPSTRHEYLELRLREPLLPNENIEGSHEESERVRLDGSSDGSNRAQQNETDDPTHERSRGTGDSLDGVPGEQIEALRERTSEEQFPNKGNIIIFWVTKEVKIKIRVKDAGSVDSMHF